MRKWGIDIADSRERDEGIVIIIAITGVLHIDGRNKGNILLGKK